MRYDGSQDIKNMDAVFLYGRTIEELKKKLETFLGFCKEKNLKLKPTKMTISEEVEFGGALIRSDIVENEEVVSILPKDKRIHPSGLRYARQLTILEPQSSHEHPNDEKSSWIKRISNMDKN